MGFSIEEKGQAALDEVRQKVDKLESAAYNYGYHEGGDIEGEL